MGRPLLLLRLEGPLQSWGVRARWEIRDTQPEPTKSGIVGLLGCSLGYPRQDSRMVDELDKGLRMGVRVENPGRILEDYHTITDYLPTANSGFKHSGIRVGKDLQRIVDNPESVPATILSQRFYLEDAAFLVILETRDAVPDLLAKCADAVQNPVWPIFLGRKCCIPSRPVFEELTDSYGSIDEAIEKHPWKWEAQPQRAHRPENVTALVEVDDEDVSELATRQDKVLKSPTRQYGMRYVRSTRVAISDKGA